jgi:predicted metal-dependent phosphoesterase TrpH
MQAQSKITSSKITSNWKQPLATQEFMTGVSLHSHTSVSEETLGFIHAMFVAMPGLKRVFDYYAERSAQHGVKLDFDRANWRPPLQPKMAYDLESRQIQRLGLNSLVSITDHDTIEAAMLLRTVPSSRHIPVSVEWSAPFGQTIFHLGIHNIPSKDGMEWMRRFEAFTAAPDDARLIAMLRELHESPQVLIVFNHPLWDLHKMGPVHLAEVRRFVNEAGRCVHAIELNGLRHVKENREVARLATELGHLVISGGDRHGLEPNANLNLTSAASFTEFVEEIRVDRVSHVHFMDQYQDRWEQRILRSALNAVTDFPEFMPGWQRWDERAFHPDKDGVMRSFAELWPEGRAPWVMRGVVKMVRLGGVRGLSAPLSLAFPGVNRVDRELGVGMEWV